MENYFNEMGNDIVLNPFCLGAYKAETSSPIGY